MNKRFLTILMTAMLGMSWIMPAQAGRWIDAGELETMEDVIIVDARAQRDYLAGHIPGAVNAPWQSLSDMSGKPGDANWGVVLSPDKLGEAIGKLGISNESRVVVYSASPAGWGEDGRVAWTLIQAGVADTVILDGGIDAWTASGGELSTTPHMPEPTTFEVVQADMSLTADKQDVLSAIDGTKIIDARTPEEFEGSQKLGEARGGHLPGAVNIPWTEVFDENGQLLDADLLQAKMEQSGIGRYDEIIAYCTAGIRSAHMALALRDAGFSKARNYDASFHEWAGDPSLPLE